MDYFEFRDDVLCCDGLSVKEIAAKVGTPFYLYSGRTLLRHCTNIHSAFKRLDHLTCYSLKANSNLAILGMFAAQGIGADIVSGGELFRARKAGFPAAKIVYSGIGKTESEIRYALSEGILCFNVESIPELEAMDRIAGDMGKVAPVAFRVNPDVDPKTHPYISTGLNENKFGIPISGALDAYMMADDMKNVRIIGIDAHIGSQITSVGPFVESAEKLVAFVERLHSRNIKLENVDIGGGLGIRYSDEDPPSPEEWVGAISPILERSGCRVIFEPGRSMVGNAGILVTAVLYTKKTPSKTFVIVDAGMNDLIRPAFYGSHHEILSVEGKGGTPEIVDVVGPICESGDFLAKGREIPLPQSGGLLAVMSAGAYGFTMSSNYNSRPRCAEVLVREGQAEVVRERESYSDLIVGESSRGRVL